MKIEIWVNYSYGWRDITFKKLFDFPFVPFHDLVINDYDETEEHENDVHLATNDYCRTRIDYNVKTGIFNVDIREHWNRPVSDETIDDIIKRFTNTGWERRDNTNIEEMKAFMKSEHERITRK